jgi:peroxiredoxin
MKRSWIVALVLIVGIVAMIWSGVMAYKMRKYGGGANSMTSLPMQMQMTPGANHQSAPNGDSSAMEGMVDLRGKPAPNFTLKSIDGKTVSLADYRGKAVLINFWATWCGPCKFEIPWLVELQKKYADQGFTVIGISEDDGPVSNVEKFAAKMGMNYPVVMGDEKVAKAYGGIAFLPASFYIGRDGRVVTEVGGLISESEMEADIRKSLAVPAENHDGEQRAAGPAKAQLAATLSGGS